MSVPTAAAAGLDVKSTDDKTVSNTSKSPGRPLVVLIRGEDGSSPATDEMVFAALAMNATVVVTGFYGSQLAAEGSVGVRFKEATFAKCDWRKRLDAHVVSRASPRDFERYFAVKYVSANVEVSAGKITAYITDLADPFQARVLEITRVLEAIRRTYRWGSRVSRFDDMSHPFGSDVENSLPRSDSDDDDERYIEVTAEFLPTPTVETIELNIGWSSA